MTQSFCLSLLITRERERERESESERQRGREGEGRLESIMALTKVTVGPSEARVTRTHVTSQSGDTVSMFTTR